MPTITRRQALRQLSVAAAGLALAACTPLRVLVNAYPRVYDDDEELLDRVLRAFVTTVIPGAPSDAPDLVRAYTDPAYPFAEYVGFFAADLCRRAARRFGGRPFDQLTTAERTAVIAEGLAADGTTRRLYNGAIVLAQVAFYAGIYDDENGCALIGFEGRYRWHSVTNITHPHPERFVSRALTGDGNYA